jgi:hypothetical protein
MVTNIDRDIDELSARASRARWSAIILVAIGGAVAAPSVNSFAAGALTGPALGDTLAGTTGVIWALAGLAMIFAAFTLQQQQLLVQRRDLDATQAELAESRKEMKAQTDLFAAQNDAIVAQRFESSFFQILEAHEAFARDLTFTQGHSDFTGRAVFVRIYGLMMQRTAANHMHLADFTLQKAVDVYDDLYRELDSILGPYFRSLFQVVSWIDASEHSHLDKATRHRYSNILRARLSSDELLVFFYNMGTEQGRGFLPLATKYNLLKHLPKDRLLQRAHWEALHEQPTR